MNPRVFYRGRRRLTKMVPEGDSVCVAGGGVLDHRIQQGMTWGEQVGPGQGGSVTLRLRLDVARSKGNPLVAGRDCPGPPGGRSRKTRAARSEIRNRAAPRG